VQFKQHEKRLLKVVIYHYTNNYNTKKMHFVVRKFLNVAEAGPKNGGEIGREKG
jgi:hypothetical protein